MVFQHCFLHDSRMGLVIASKIKNDILSEVLGLFLEDLIIRHVSHIPKDPGHRTKIDYEALRLLF